MLFGQATPLETLLGQVAGLFSAGAVPAGVSPDSSAALAGQLPLFPPERVYLSLAPEAIFEADPPADQFLVVRPSRCEALSSIVSGAGNLVLGSSATMVVTLWNRFESDTALSDSLALTDPTYGILAKWKLCLALLSQFVPIDDSGNGLVIEPIRFLRWSLQERSRHSPWTLLRSEWEMKFNQAFE